MSCFILILIIGFNHASCLNEIGAVQSVIIHKKIRLTTKREDWQKTSKAYSEDWVYAENVTDPIVIQLVTSINF